MFIDGLDIDEIIEVSKASWMSTSGRCYDQDLFKQAVEEVVGTLHDKESESRVLTSRRLGFIGGGRRAFDLAALHLACYKR